MAAVAECLDEVIIAPPEDKGLDSESRPPKPCCERIAHGVWCQLEDGHPTGFHASHARPVYGPLGEPELLRRHRGLT